MPLPITHTYTSMPATYNQKIISLIKQVNDNYDHIEQLETLCELLDGKPEQLIAITTYNSYYDYHLFMDQAYKHSRNHVDKVYIDRFVAP